MPSSTLHERINRVFLTCVIEQRQANVFFVFRSYESWKMARNIPLNTCLELVLVLSTSGRSGRGMRKSRNIRHTYVSGNSKSGIIARGHFLQNSVNTKCLKSSSRDWTLTKEDSSPHIFWRKIMKGLSLTRKELVDTIVRCGRLCWVLRTKHPMSNKQ